VPKQQLSPPLTDPVILTQHLIACPSITPLEGGALDLLQTWLEALSFHCYRLPFQEPGTAKVDNLFAIRPAVQPQAPHFCFAGHTDVVPPGDLVSWQSDPFLSQIQDSFLIGRGAVDMKGAIAAFVAAIAELTTQEDHLCTLSLLITGDEEGVAVNGTRKVLPWLQEQGYVPDFCLVGEPSSQAALGDTIKIGRRGSLNTVLTVQGVQGHVAFPQRAQNPIPILLHILTELNQGPLEQPSQFFEPSNLEITSIDVGNQTTNLIPETATARFNIRFNDRHTGQSLAAWIQTVAAKYTSSFKTEFEFSGEAEFLKPNALTDLMSQAITEVTGQQPQLTTAGATSDARFIRYYCPVVEFGLVGQTMHQANECVAVQDLRDLKTIYQKIITAYRASIG
jgi:succinyldiaminopimelate desuccinylase (EC 3.5.1.18)